MKKTLSILISVFFMLSVFTVNTFAESNATVFGETITAKKGEEQLVLIKIKNNPGIMGFKIRLAYLSDCVEVIDISRGDLTKAGNFNTNLGKKDGMVDVLWNDTKNATGDGVLFVVRLKVLTDEPFSIYLSFSEPDTFNENWGNVTLTCYEINNKSYLEANKDIENTSETTTEYIEITPTIDMLEQTISSILDNEKISSLENLTESQKNDLLQKVNTQIKNYYGKDEYYKDFDEIEKDYKNNLQQNFIDSVANIDTEKQPDEIIKNATEKIGSKTLTDENVSKVMKELEKNGLNEKYSNFLTVEELRQEIKKVLNLEKTNISVKTIVITVIVIVILLMFFAILLLKIKNKKKGEINIEQDN